MAESPTLSRAIAGSAALTKKFGTSYYLAMKLLPASTRRAVYALYGFVRTIDEVVDSGGGDPEQVQQSLTTWRNEFAKACATGTSENPVLEAAAWVFTTYAIPLEFVGAFMDAMYMDTTVSRYETYHDLQTYMYGSAAVIGLMMSYIIGVKDETAYEYAKDLGYAMQLTNFLRDIREDLELRNRIYIPQEDMAQFGVTEEMLRAGMVIPEHKALIKPLMQFEIARARALYTNADRGIPLLNKEGRKAVTLARVLYSKILDQIEDADYDVFSARRRTTTYQKIKSALPIILS
jgi:phytoene synthase